MTTQTDPLTIHQTWEDIYGIAIANGCRFSGTGIVRAGNKDAMRAGLPQYVDPIQSGHVALADLLLRLAEKDEAVVDSFETAPSEETARALIGCVPWALRDCASHPAKSITGQDNGRWHGRENSESLETLEAPVSGMATGEANQARDETLAKLTVSSRKTAVRLLTGYGCPDDCNPAAWRKRVSVMRQEWRTIWDAR